MKTKITGPRMSLALASEGSHQWSKEGMWSQEDYPHSVRPSLWHFLGVEVMYLFSHWPIPITSSVFNHIGRKNQYDGVEEYYVDVREKGTREEKEEQEEIKRSREKLEDRSCLCTQMITSFQQMITSKNQNHSQILLCFYPSVGVTLIRFLPINAPAQESQKPT